MRNTPSNGLRPRAQNRAPKGSGPTGGAAWQPRSDGILADDLSNARRILAENGLEAEQARRYVEYATPSGVISFKPGAPAAFQDPTHPVCYAVRLLLLAEFAANADPQALLLGRQWGRAAMGMNFPAIAHSMQAWWLGGHRGKGGRRENDLTRTLRTLLQRYPEASPAQILDMLRSNDAEDEFYSTAGSHIHVLAVELDDRSKMITYTDRARKTCKVSFRSLERKLRTLRAQNIQQLYAVSAYETELGY